MVHMTCDTTTETRSVLCPPPTFAAETVAPHAQTCVPWTTIASRVEVVAVLSVAVGVWAIADTRWVTRWKVVSGAVRGGTLLASRRRTVTAHTTCTTTMATT